MCFWGLSNKMKIELIKFIEEEDGSGIMEVELDEEAKQFLIDKGLNDVLRQALKEYKPVK